jgi:ribosomal protein S1
MHKIFLFFKKKLDFKLLMYAKIKCKVKEIQDNVIVCNLDNLFKIIINKNNIYVKGVNNLQNYFSMNETIHASIISINV